MSMPKLSAMAGSETVARQATPMRVRVTSAPSKASSKTAAPTLNRSISRSTTPPRVTEPHSGTVAKDSP
jgi:hypothetical protein